MSPSPVTQPQKQGATALDAAPYQSLNKGALTKLTLAVDNAAPSTYLRARQSRWDAATQTLYPRALEESLLVRITFVTKVATLQTATKLALHWRNVASGRYIAPHTVPVGGVTIGIVDLSLLGSDADYHSFTDVISPTNPDTLTQGLVLEATANGTCSVMLTGVQVIVLG